MTVDDFANEWFPRRLKAAMHAIGDGPHPGLDGVCRAVADGFWVEAKARGLTDLGHEREGRPVTFRCGLCRDEMWVETGEGTVRPCAVCRPGLFARWRGGHLDARHDRAGCAVCSGRRSEGSPDFGPVRKDLA